MFGVIYKFNHSSIWASPKESKREIKQEVKKARYRPTQTPTPTPLPSLSCCRQSRQALGPGFFISPPPLSELECSSFLAALLSGVPRAFKPEDYFTASNIKPKMERPSCEGDPASLFSSVLASLWMLMSVRGPAAGGN